MTLTDVFKQAGSQLAATAGQSGPKVEAALQSIAEKLEPDFEEALLSSDPNAVNFIADRSAAAAAQELSGEMASLKDTLSAVASFVIKAAIVGAMG